MRSRIDVTLGVPAIQGTKNRCTRGFSFPPPVILLPGLRTDPTYQEREEQKFLSLWKHEEMQEDALSPLPATPIITASLLPEGKA